MDSRVESERPMEGSKGVGMKPITTEQTLKRAQNPRKGDTFKCGFRKIIVQRIKSGVVHCLYFRSQRDRNNFQEKLSEWPTIVKTTLDREGATFHPAKRKINK